VILSGRDLAWYVEKGKLKITPSVPEQFQQNGFDAVLDQVSEGADPLYAAVEGGHFYLGCTRETFELPDDLMAFVGIRSTWARLGFSVPLTIVDAGFRGNLTLEILKFGRTPPPVGEPFAHLIFAKMTSPSAPYRGKYDQQSGITEAIHGTVKP
jgi:dCTP deaminase